MTENIRLISEIQELRKKVKHLDTLLKKAKNIQKKQASERAMLNRTNQPNENDVANLDSALNDDGGDLMDLGGEQDPEQAEQLKSEIEMKERYVEEMRQNLQSKLQEAQELAQQFDEAMNQAH